MSRHLREDAHPAIRGLVEEMRSGALDRREFLRFATLLGMSASAAYAVAGMPQAAAQTGEPKRGGVVRMSMRIPDLSSPHSYSWVFDSNVSRQVVEYLTRTGIDNITRPHLLEKWEASEDLKTWTLMLRPDVKWSNGEDLTADHVIWNMRRWLDPAVGSSMVGLMKGYMLEETDGPDGKKTTRLWSDKAIEKIDGRTVRLNCKAAQVAVPEHLFHYPAAIMHPSSEGKFGVGAIGTGPFSITELETGRRVVLQRREGYWGKGPHIDRFEVQDLGDDAAAALNALGARQVDGLFEASTTQYAALRRMDHVDIHTVNTAQTGVARMQPTGKPFDDPRVRKAMRLALDTRKLLEVGHLGLGSPGEHHHVSPVQPEYSPLPFPEQNVTEAKRLMAEAGYAKGFYVEIACRKDPAWESIVVQAMVEMWKVIDARVKINLMPSTQFWDIWTKVPFAFTAWTHRPLAVMTLPLAYRTGSSWNESKWSNARMDELLTKAEGTLNVAQRREIMREIEMLMQEDGPIAQPLWKAAFTAVDKKVKGYKIHPTLYMFAEEWWVEG